MSKDIVTGKSVEDILNMDVSKLTESELRKITGRLVSAGNKRARRMMAKDVMSPALNILQDTGGMLSTRGKSINQLRAEFKRAKNFLQSETSSLAGYKKVKKETMAQLKKEGIKISDKEWDVFWRAYEELKKQDPSIAVKGLKYEVLQEISKIMVKGDSVEDVVNNMAEKMSKIYEEKSRLDDSTSVSEFFEM